MGNLCSSKKRSEPEPEQTQPHRTEPSQNIQNHHSYYTEQDLLWEIQRQIRVQNNIATRNASINQLRPARPSPLGKPSTVQEKIVKVTLNASLMNILNPCCEPLNVRYTNLNQFEYEYQMINKMITNKYNFKVDGIERVENPLLYKAYQLKKEARLKEYPRLEERLLFHGTKHANVDVICKFNFNWRRSVRHKFGQGVSFSPKATYAANYSDEYEYNKVMIVAKVLVGKSCMGGEHMKLPQTGCDTSQKGSDGIVIVKYEDNEFYPAYKLSYHLRQQRKHL